MRDLSAFSLLLLIFVVPVESHGQHVDRLSVTSLKLTIRKGDIELGSATGFVVEKHQKYYLVTNRHVVLHCSEDKNPNNVGGWLCADNLQILHNKANHPGEWIVVQEDLYDEHNGRRWVEHSTLGGSIDLVALPLRRNEGVAFLPLDLSLRNTQMVLGPGDPVSIVGFPFGAAQSGGLAIWKTGTLASDPEVDAEGKPRLLLDTTARPGMSGSPVYAKRSGTYELAPGVVQAGTATKFLGVYAEENFMAEIGFVWKADIVASLYDSLP